MIEYAFGKIYSFFYKTYVLNLDIIAFSFVSAICMALIVLAIEVFYLGYAKSGLYRLLRQRSRSTVTDIAYFIIHTSSLITVFSMMASLGIPHAISSLFRSAVQLDAGKLFPPWGHLALYLLMADFMAYWQHRIMHRVPALWKIHEFHHSAEEFNTLTVFREHPLDKSLNSISMILPAVILGSPTHDFVIFVTVYGMIGYIKHSEIPWHGWFGKWVIQSPRDHHIHHSKKVEHHDTNFANSLAIWDHIFGTYYKGNDFNSELGLDVDYLNRSNPLADTLGVQARFLRALGEAPTRVFARINQAR